MKHIVFYSGGIGSWYSAKRVIEKLGKENVILLFTDTKIEDEDLYRFLYETAEKFDVKLEVIADGKDVWDTFYYSKYLGNSRIAPCSSILKQKTAKKWIKNNFKPDECVLYLGIDWTEMHRVESPKKNWLPYKVEFPMTEEPFVDKQQMIQELNDFGIEEPRLYKMGFAHNNCGGFCCRAGQGHFINLLEKLPERFQYHEEREQQFIKDIGKDQAMLRKMVNGVRLPYTLKQLREDYQQKQCQIDMFDIGGCGCFVEDDKEGDENDSTV